jgi:hypothetical protein
MARLEGFEPPTLRSEVRSNPHSDKLAEGKSLFLWASPLFSFSSISAVSYQCGNNDGNKNRVAQRARVMLRLFVSQWKRDHRKPWRALTRVSKDKTGKTTNEPTNVDSR